MVLSKQKDIQVLDQPHKTEESISIIRVNGGLLIRPKLASEMEAQVKILSHREIEILGYVADGNPNKEIACILKISEQTVRNHIASILRKLNAKNRTHAVVLALRHGWIPI